MRRLLPLLVALLSVGGAGSRVTGSPQGAWSVEQRPAGLVISRGGVAVAEFLLGDDAMRRPGLANLRAPQGTPVTRSHPPREGRDATDHAAMHPGLWLAFGDVSGEDFWRNQARMEHLGFDEDPRASADGVRFTARARLRSSAGADMGTIENRLAIVDEPEGRVVAWVATIRAEGAPLVLGDQEEMGFGVRLATGLEEKAGGRIVNSAGESTAAGTWGRVAGWCHATGVDGRTGVTVVADPGNFRPSWWHNRDYGLLVANPFGRRALARGEPSLVTVPPGEPLRLAFAAVLHDGDPAGPAADPAAAAAAALELLRERFGAGAAGE